VEFEQAGRSRAEYGESLLLRLAEDLTACFGRWFGKSNLFLMRKFYESSAQIFQTVSGKLAIEKHATLSHESLPLGIAQKSFGKHIAKTLRLV
jgi:hypothetical protein